MKFPNGWVDYDFDLFAEIAAPLDRRLDEFEEMAEADFGLADALDVPLKHEHILGMGFVAAQLYLVSVISECEAPRQQALSLGPRAASGLALAALVNHGANYWKHADEWNPDVSNARRGRILDAFEQLGFEDDDFSLWALLKRITGSAKPRLLDLSPILEHWHDAVDAQSRQAKCS